MDHTPRQYLMPRDREENIQQHTRDLFWEVRKKRLSHSLTLSLPRVKKTQESL